MMKKKSLPLVLVNVVALAGILLAAGACAPTIRAVPEDVIESESIRIAREEGRQEGRREGRNLCRQELETRLRDFVRSYRDELLYLELTKGGAILPAQISLIYNPAKVSQDGSSYSAPTLVWKIVSPPRFVSDDSGGDWLSKDRANFCYFLVDSFSTEAEAFSFLGTSPKPDDVFVTIAPHGDGGKWAVIAKTFKLKCDGAMEFYRKLGRQPIRVE
ncbi:MAG TPA: hypothetical protein DDZ40_13580 [Deltaproteobacteria bacterium]|nr:hypothetical protein [Deltaproteobacteria bacterium]